MGDVVRAEYIAFAKYAALYGRLLRGLRLEPWKKPPNSPTTCHFPSKLHNASVSSIDAACVHDLRIMVAHGFRHFQKKQL
jgi:hypothetical protein